MHGHQHRFGGHGPGAEAWGRFTAGAPLGPMAFLHGMGQVAAQRMRRGDVRQAVLRLLLEQPMHGYQIIGELSARSGGAWKPSAGSIYPTLQLLADEGLVVAEEVGGKKVFRLTDAGRAAVADAEDQPAPWDEVAQQRPGVGGYQEAVAKLARAVFQVGKAGTPQQVEAGVAVLNDARKRLYMILSED